MSHTNFISSKLTFMPVNNLALHVRKRMFINYKKAGTVNQHVSQMSHITAAFSSEGSNLF
jgi:hypothetical protein